MFCCLPPSPARALLCIPDLQFVEEVILQAVVTCSEPEDADLLLAAEQVVDIMSVVLWMLLFPQVFLLGLDDGSGLRVGGRLVLLPFGSTFLSQSIRSLISMQVAVGRNLLQGDCVTPAEGSEGGDQVVQLRVSARLQGLQDRHGIR